MILKNIIRWFDSLSFLQKVIYTLLFTPVIVPLIFIPKINLNPNYKRIIIISYIIFLIFFSLLSLSSLTNFKNNKQIRDNKVTEVQNESSGIKSELSNTDLININEFVTKLDIKITKFSCSYCQSNLLDQKDLYKNIDIVDTQVYNPIKKLGKGSFDRMSYLFEITYPENSYTKDVKSYYFNDKNKKTEENSGIRKAIKISAKNFKSTNTKTYIIYDPSLVGSGYTEPFNALLSFSIQNLNGDRVDKEFVFYSDQRRESNTNECNKKIYCDYN
jgi:hypothetical protein